jgi:hypothetical protein
MNSFQGLNQDVESRLYQEPLNQDVESGLNQPPAHLVQQYLVVLLCLDDQSQDVKDLPLPDPVLLARDVLFLCHQSLNQEMCHDRVRLESDVLLQCLRGSYR